MSERLTQVPCFLCVDAVKYSNCALHLIDGERERERQREFWLDGMRFVFDILQGSTPLYMLAGYPAAWLDFVRQMDTESARWLVNNEQVRVWAEINLFGLGVCLNHTHGAMELYRQGGYRR